MKKILLFLLAFAVLPAFCQLERFGSIKTTKEITTGFENYKEIDIEDGYRVNMLMAGFVNKSFVLDGSAISNDYVWVETTNISATVTVKNLHIFGKYRYNYFIKDNYNQFATLYFHMPKIVSTDPYLYDWHMSFFTENEELNVVYVKDDGISYVKNGFELVYDGILDEYEVFFSFVEFGAKGRYLCVGMPLIKVK